MTTTSDYIAFALVFIALGGAVWAAMFGVNWILATRRAAQSDRLKPVPGRLRSIAPRYDELPGRARVGSYWTVAARFDYEIDGAAYSGDRFALEFNSWFPDEDSAVAAAGRFTAGDQVTVWYDPDSPSTAVLDKAPPARRNYYRDLALLAAGAAVLAAVGAALAISG